jgi:uncharacterized protein (DUF1501 family)
MAFVPSLIFAKAQTDRRFVFIIQRGAADGLDTVVPIGDPDYARLRGAMALDSSTTLPLGEMFALHGALQRVGQLYQAKQALFCHAVATPYRDRSHFDGQNILESGATAPFAREDGWLNRLLTLLPGSGAVALTPTAPLALRGPAPVATYAPSGLPDAGDDLMTRVDMLYADDPLLHPLWGEAMSARGMTDGVGKQQDATAIGKLTAGFLAKPEGARIAMIETLGWDTHTAQDTRLNRQLTQLDNLLGSLVDNLGPIWKDTVVVVATEFGRTAAMNGTGGTDHGTASLAMVLGGAVKGGRVLTDWPGLSAGALYQNRDLKPTRALDTVLASAAAQCFRLDPQKSARTLFPGSMADKTLEPLTG